MKYHTGDALTQKDKRIAELNKIIDALSNENERLITAGKEDK